MQRCTSVLLLLSASLGWSQIAYAECGKDFHHNANYYGGYLNSSTIFNYFSNAALNVDGSIASWGDAANGGAGAPAGNNFRRVYSNYESFTALTDTGELITWGEAGYGAGAAPADSGYLRVYSTGKAFAAIKADGQISAWGDTGFGGAGAPSQGNYRQIYSNGAAFAALGYDGTISTWGDPATGGTGPIGGGQEKIYSTYDAFSALKNDGSIVAWGDATAGGAGAPSDSGYTQIFSNFHAFAALKADGSISAWGRATSGGTGAPAGSGYDWIYSNQRAFAVLEPDGSITTWGDPAIGGAGGPADNGYVRIYATRQAFAALKTDGTISVWGDVNEGASAGVPTDGGYDRIFSNTGAFAAMKPDGSISAWGNASKGGTGAPIDDGYTGIAVNQHSFIAFKPDGSLTTWGVDAAGTPAQTGFSTVNGSDGGEGLAKLDDCQTGIALGIDEVIEDISSNADGVPATADTINSIFGVSGAVTGNEAFYTVGFQSADYADPAVPVPAEIQSVVDLVNTLQLIKIEVAEDIAGNTNGVAVSAVDLNSLDGVDDALQVNEDHYTAGFQSSYFADSNNPTATEIQAVISAVNYRRAAIDEVVEDIAGNANGVSVTAVQLNAITALNDAVDAYNEHYSEALQTGFFVDPADPSVEEIQTVIDAVNLQRNPAGSEGEPLGEDDGLDEVRGGGALNTWSLFVGLIGLCMAIAARRLVPVDWRQATCAEEPGSGSTVEH